MTDRETMDEIEYRRYAFETVSRLNCFSIIKRPGTSRMLRSFAGTITEVAEQWSTPRNL